MPDTVAPAKITRLPVTIRLPSQRPRISATSTSARARRLRLGPDGRFVGRAEVEVAEIRGRCEGNLIVTGSLVIFAGATVSGTTRYRQIVIEAGGGLLGQVQLLPKAPVEAARA